MLYSKTLNRIHKLGHIMNRQFGLYFCDENGDCGGKEFIAEAILSTKGIYNDILYVDSCSSKFRKPIKETVLKLNDTILNVSIACNDVRIYKMYLYKLRVFGFSKRLMSDAEIRELWKMKEEEYYSDEACAERFLNSSLYK